MKIAIVTKRFHTNLYFQVKALKDAGHEVDLLVWSKGKSESYDILEPFVIGYAQFFTRLNSWLEKIPSKKMVNFLKFKLPFINLEEMIDYRRLKAKLKELKPDVALVRAYPGFSFLMMTLYARRYSGKVFLLAQLNKHYGETLRKKIYLFFLKKILRLQGIITPLENILPQKDKFFIYLPFVIAAPDFVKQYFKNNRINVISVGKFMERKEHLLLLRVINELKNKYDLTLTIIGERVNETLFRQIEKFIKENNLSDIVTVASNLPHREVLQKYRDFDLFVLPAHSEPAAYSPLEAMAAKLPVIVSDTCGTRGYIKEGENGYVFHSRSAEDLKNKMELIIGDREKFKRLGEASFARVNKYYAPGVFVREFQRILQIK
ncbi:MAG TPA: glycosyltransferase family 4 protein [Candidatus Methylomirabilis sp.]|nr:glycosyltransferase family 4 protein [Candidatus Methylomirabilis sp.]